MKIRPTKDHAIKAAIELTPQYADWLIELQKGKGQSLFSKEITSIQNNVGTYVLLYDDERKIGSALFLSLLGDEGFKEFTSEIEKLSPEEQQEWVEDISNPENNEIAETFSSIKIPSTSEEWQAAKDLCSQLPEEERNRQTKQGAYLWCFLFSSFFNTLSLMVHGARLTTLVPQAIAGNEDAYLKAIQIDRMLLLHHPFFRERKFRAQDECEDDFLTKIAYRESNPLLRSKVRYPALYMLFGILDTYRWLSDLSHREILDICELAQLDRFQNKIEDENYITKRLIEYRRWQKTGGVSMH